MAHLVVQRSESDLVIVRGGGASGREGGASGMVVHAGAGAIEVVGVAAEIQEARSGPIQRRTNLLSKVLISHAPLRTQVDHALSPSETEKLSVEILMGGKGNASDTINHLVVAVLKKKTKI